MGLSILSSLYCLIIGARPFCSESLDRLAENMKVAAILRNDNPHRYYVVKTFEGNAVSFLDRLIFDSEYFEMLLPSELIAVGAHEFSHVINRDGMKRFVRLVIPAVLIASLFSFVFFLSYSVPRILIPYQLLAGLSVAVLSFFTSLIAALYFNARWHRKTEIECDIGAVEFADGEALIAALEKARVRHPVDVRSLGYRLGPKLYPSFEERADSIRRAMRDRSGRITS